MRDNISNNLTLSDFTDFTNLSSSQLNKIFKNNLNTSPVNFYNTLKIEYASNLLSSTNFSINEIAKILTDNNIQFITQYRFDDFVAEYKNIFAIKFAVL